MGPTFAFAETLPMALGEDLPNSMGDELVMSHPQAN